MLRKRSMRGLLAAVMVTAFIGPLQLASPADAITLPSGFQEQVVYSGLTQPTNIEFAPDGRVFVAEKSGRIKVFDDLADTTPTLFADLSAKVHNQWDRGLLGLTLAVDEGLELNLLGLVFGIDPLDLAIKLPGIGRIGMR